MGKLLGVVALAATVATAGWVAPSAAHAWDRSDCGFNPAISTRTVGLDSSVTFWNSMAVGIAINHWNDSNPPLTYEMSYNTSGADIIVSETSATLPQPAFIYECHGGGGGASRPWKLLISTTMLD